MGYEKLLFNFILDNPKPLFRAGCSLSPVLNLSLHFVGSVFGRSELHGKLMGKAHSAIAVFFRKVGRRSNLSNDGFPRLIYLRDFILRFFFGHKFEHLFGCVPPDRAYLDQSHGGHLSGRAARGSVAPRKMACRSAVGFDISTRFKAIDARTAWPQPGWEGIMTRVLFLSITLGTLVVWDAAAQQLVPKPGKRKRVLSGRLGCEAKTFYARPGCRRMRTGGFVGLPGAFKVVCGGQ